MATQPERPQMPPMEIPADLQPIYSNLVRISHSAAEIVFDFAYLLPAQPAPRIQTRVVMSPMGAKMFLRALTDNLGRYEASFGPVQLPTDPSLADDLFKPHPPTPPADKK
ncbi:MAG TPA: DUF3467 domain-containing protein [Longilinea sp.]|nr:DUF3467 domain-containing protein [Longilinea sp.]